MLEYFFSNILKLFLCFDIMFENVEVMEVIKLEENKPIYYDTPNGIIFSIDIFKGKKALVGDYFPFSYANTKIVLESLGMVVIIEKTIDGIKNRILNGEQYDVIFTNNIYRSGTGSQLLKELKEIEGFNTPLIIHTISEEPIQYFLNLGFDGCLKKPIKQKETIQVLKKLL